MGDGGVTNTVWELLFGTGVIQGIQERLPTSVIDFIGLTTHLGDGTLLVGIAVSLYWLRHDRRSEYAYVIAVGLGALALVAGLKALFVHPRPPEGVWLANEANYGFPSAHALGTTVVFGLLAHISRVGTRTQRYVFAATLVGLVSLSRIVLGVHYPGDVLGGIVIGLAYLAVVLRYTEGRPMAAFAIALGLAVLMAAIAPNEYTTATLGGSLGALIGWSLARESSDSPPVVTIAAVLVAAVPISLGARELVSAAGPLVEVAGFGFVVIVTVLVPAIATAVERATGFGYRLGRFGRIEQLRS